MSNRIHMQTENVRQLARKLDHTSAEMDQSHHQLNQQRGRLSIAWQGDRARSYVNRYNNLLNNLHANFDQLQRLALLVSREVDQWQEADQDGSLSLRRVGTCPVPPYTGFVMPTFIGLITKVGGWIKDGISALYRTGLDTLNDAGELISAAGAAAILASDQKIEASLHYLLYSDDPSTTESVKFKLSGDVTIPGVEVGVPGSLKLKGAKSAELIRNPDGTYTLVLSGEAEGGLKESLVDVNGHIKVNKTKIGTGVDVSAEALGGGNAEARFKFDPNTPGDMTKMLAFMGALGVMQLPEGAPLVGPALYTMKDNLVGFKAGRSGDGKVNADASVLVKLAGIEAKVSGTNDYGMAKNDQGHWEASQEVELSGEVKTEKFFQTDGLEVKTSLESIKDLTTGHESSKVSFTVTKTEGGGVDFDAESIKGLLPKNAKNVSFHIDESNAIKIEYTLDQPADTVKSILTSDSPADGLQNLLDHSKLEIQQIHANETGVGAGANIGAVTQTIGVGIDADVTRQSTKTIYEYTGAAIPGESSW